MATNGNRVSFEKNTAQCLLSQPLWGHSVPTALMRVSGSHPEKHEPALPQWALSGHGCLHISTPPCLLSEKGVPVACLPGRTQLIFWPHSVFTSATWGQHHRP